MPDNGYRSFSFDDAPPANFSRFLGGGAAIAEPPMPAEEFATHEPFSFDDAPPANFSRFFEGQQVQQMPALPEVQAFDLPELTEDGKTYEFLTKSGYTPDDVQNMRADEYEQFKSMAVSGEQPKPTLRVATSNLDLVERAQKALRQYDTENPVKSWGRYFADRSIPGFSTGKQLGSVWHAKTAADKIDSQPLSEDEALLLARYLNDQEDDEKRSKDNSWTGWAKRGGDIVANVPALAGEIAATGGIGTAAKASIRGVAMKLLARQMAKRTVGGALARGAIKTAGAGAKIATQTALMPHRIAKTAVERQMRMPGDNRPRESWAESGAHGAFQMSVELLSELYFGKLLQGLVGKPTGYVARKLAEKTPALDPLRERLMKSWAAKTGQSIQAGYEKLSKATSWNGIIGELGEERFNEVVLGIAGELGAKGQEYDFGAMGHLANGDFAKAWNQIGPELLAFGLPTAMVKTARLGVMLANLSPKEKEAVESYKKAQSRSTFNGLPEDIQQEGSGAGQHDRKQLAEDLFRADEATSPEVMDDLFSASEATSPEIEPQDQGKGVIRDGQEEGQGGLQVAEPAAQFAAGADVGSAPAFDPELQSLADEIAAGLEPDVSQDAPVVQSAVPEPRSMVGARNQRSQWLNQTPDIQSSPTMRGRSPGIVSEEAAMPADQPAPASLPPAGPSPSSQQPGTSSPPPADDAGSAAAAVSDTAKRGAIPTESAGLQRNPPAPRIEESSPPSSTSAVSSPAEAPAREAKPKKSRRKSSDKVGNRSTNPIESAIRTLERDLETLASNGNVSNPDVVRAGIQKKIDDLKANQSAEPRSDSKEPDTSGLRYVRPAGEYINRRYKAEEFSLDGKPEWHVTSGALNDNLVFQTKDEAIAKADELDAKSKKDVSAAEWDRMLAKGLSALTDDDKPKRGSSSKNEIKEPSNAVPAKVAEAEQNAAGDAQGSRRSDQVVEADDRPMEAKEGSQNDAYRQRIAKLPDDTRPGVEKLLESLQELQDEARDLTDTVNVKEGARQIARVEKTLEKYLKLAESTEPAKPKVSKAGPKKHKPVTDEHRAAAEDFKKRLADPETVKEITRSLKRANGKTGAEQLSELTSVLFDPQRLADRPSATYDPTKPFIPWAIAQAKMISQPSGTERAHKPQSLSERAANARQEVRDAAQDFGDSLGDATLPNLGSFSGESLKKFAVLTAKLVKAGALTFADYTAELAKLFPAKVIEALRPHMRSAFDAALSEYQAEQDKDAGFGEAPVAIEEPPVEPPTTPTVPNKSGTPTPRAIKNAHAIEQRAALGLPPLKDVDLVGHTFPELAEQAAAQNPAQIDKLVSDLSQYPRPATDFEDALLLRRQVELDNAYEDNLKELLAGHEAKDDGKIKAATDEQRRLLAEIEKLTDITKAVGTAQGRALAARKLLQNRDFTVARSVQEYKATHEGKEPNAELMEKFKKQADELKALHEQLAERDATIKAKDEEIALTKAHKEAHAKASRSKAATPSSGAQKARARIDNGFKMLGQMRGKVYSIEGVATDLTKALAEIARGYAELGVYTFTDAMKRFKARVGSDADSMRAEFKTEWDKAIGEKGPSAIADKIDVEDPRAIGDAARTLHQYVIERDDLTGSEADRDRAVAGVHELLNEFVPELDLSLKDVARILSGKDEPTRKLSDEEIRTEHRAQLQLLEDIAAWQNNQRPNAMQETRPVSDEQRKLRRERNEAKKNSNVKTPPTANQLRSALDAAKTAARNRIADLTKALSPPQTPIQRTTTVGPTDAELVELREERDKLQKQYDEVFGKPGMSDAAYIKMLEKRAEVWAGKVAKKDFQPAAKRTPRVLDERMKKLKHKIFQSQQDILAMRHEWQRQNLYWFAKGLMVPVASAGFYKSFRMSVDLAVGRQGWLMALTHPIVTAGILRKHFAKTPWKDKSLFPTEEDAFSELDELENGPNADLYKMAKLEFLRFKGDLTHRAENVGSELAAKLPWVGGSERANATSLNAQKAGAFHALVDNLVQGGWWVGGDHSAATPSELRIIGNALNVFQGRAQFGHHAPALQTLAQAFLSPRWWVSRLQILSGQPLWSQSRGAFGEGSTWRVRRLMAKEVGKSAAALLAMYGVVGAGLFAALGSGGPDKEWELDIDNQSATFGQVRIGKRWFDLSSSLAQHIVLASQLAPNWMGGGKRTDYRGVSTPIRGPARPYTAKSGWGLMGMYLLGKVDLVPKLAADVVAGETISGKPLTLKEVAANNLPPLFWNDVAETMKDNGIPKGTALSFLVFLGLNSKQEKRDPVMVKQQLAMLATTNLSTEKDSDGKLKVQSGADKGKLRSERDGARETDAMLNHARQVLNERVPSLADQETLLKNAWIKEHGSIREKNGDLKDSYRAALTRLRQAHKEFRRK